MNPEIITPSTPNFVKVRITKDREAVSVPIHEFTTDQLREIGEKWTNDLIASARRKRTNHV